MTTQQKFQNTYECFISMSNIAFNNNVPEISTYTIAKAEAFEASARIIVELANSLGYELNERKPDIRKFIEQEREESCRADAESEAKEFEC